jgi:hypothetical protein
MKKTIIKIMAFIALFIFCWMISTNAIWVIESGLAMPIVLILAIVLGS